jgi:uncharacterized protein involved in exopolysaccharide biosynthesis
MKRWVRVACYFYPAAWRRRYGREFDAVLDEVDTGWKDVFDTLKGALTMQFTSWNLKSIALTFTVIGAVIGASAALRLPRQYQSMSVMRLPSIVEGDARIDFAQHVNRMEREVLSRTSLEGLITELDLYKRQRTIDKRPKEDIVRDMRDHDIRIGTIQAPGNNVSPTAFSIAFSYPDPKLAQIVTSLLVSKFMEENEAYNHGVFQRWRGGDFAEVRAQFRSVGLLDPATWPQQPILPRRTQLVLIGLFAGLLAGLAVSYTMRWRIMIVRRPAQ